MASILLSVALVPFTGTLVRYRLGYYPSPVAAEPTSSEAELARAGDSDGLPVPSTLIIPALNALASNTPPPESAPTFIAVAKKIRRLEGWEGLRKGLLSTIIVSTITSIFGGHIPKIYISPAPFRSHLISAVLGTSIYSFGLVWVYRAIATPTNLRIFGTSINEALDALFTPYERTKFLRIVYPGIITALFLSVTLNEVLFRFIADFIGARRDNTVLSLIAIVISVVLRVGLCAPLEMVVTRLAVQKCYGPAVGPPTPSSNEATEVASVTKGKDNVDVDVEMGLPPYTLEPEPLTLDASEEIVVKLRGNAEPYEGVYDCFDKIIKEEGWQTLYRGWWVTLLGFFLAQS